MFCLGAGGRPAPRRATGGSQEIGQFRGSPPLLAVVSQEPEMLSVVERAARAVVQGSCC